MHALERIHGAIRPGGALLDIHPLAEHAWVEGGDGGGLVPAGQLDAARFIANVVAAEAALAARVAAGAFAVEQVATFPFFTYFDGVEEWLDYMAAEWTSADVPPALIERLRALVPGDQGTIRVRETIHAARLRRMEPAARQPD